MPNIGRNQPCPCGSGKKYKRCHGAYTAQKSHLHFPDSQVAFAQGMREAEARRVRREKQQGLGRPIIAAKLRDHQMVAVGKRVHFSDKWHTFHDFLRDHRLAFWARNGERLNWQSRLKSVTAYSGGSTRRRRMRGGQGRKPARCTSRR